MDANAERNGRVRDQSRTFGLQLLAYLDEYYSLRHPPIRDIRNYRDYILEPAGIPDSPGVRLMLGGDPWLTCSLVDPVPPPALPTSLEAWVALPIPFAVPPSLSPLDSLTKRLVELGEREEGDLDLDSLDEERLVGLGLDGVEPGSVTERIVEALEDQQEARTELDQWVDQQWTPWAEQRRAIEQGRSLYKGLFDLRTRLDREGETFELVWGFAPVRWGPANLRGEVWHPLFTVPIDIAMHPESGEISLRPDGPVAMDDRWSRDLSVVDAQSLHEQRSSIETGGVEPWNASSFEEILRPIIRALDHDGTITDDLPRATTTAAISSGHWVLYVRRRETDYPGFLRAQREIYEDATVQVPGPFAALVVDEPSALDSALAEPNEPSLRLPAMDGMERLLLPLPSNEEQARILRHAQHRVGVTAKGPPGTGKSHTIANLISHFVAQGKRVLVTAAKEQALKVLIDKVPADIRKLCVPVVGTDVAARTRLQESVTLIADAAHRDPDLNQIAHLEQQLEEIKHRYAELSNGLTAVREAEVQAAPHKPAAVTGAWTPSTAAAWVTETGATSAIPDELEGTGPPPLGDEEYAELVQLAKRVNALTSEEAQRKLPSDALPSGAHLSNLWFELGELNDLLRAASEDVEDWDKVRATPSAEWSAIADALRQHAHRLIEARTTWLGQVLSDASEPLLSGRWRDFIDGAASERESVIVAATELAPHWVEIPEEFSHRELVEAIGAARGRFDAGRPLGLGQRSSKRLLGKCKVDGETPTTVNDLSLLTAELQRRASRESLRTRWTNLQTDYRLPELNPDQPIEIQAGEHLRQVAWALDWSATTWPDEVRRLTSMGLRCPDKPSVEQLSGMADVCDSLRSEARSREITLELQALADLLVVESKDPDASVLWLQLRRALNSRKPESWDAAMQRAAELRALVSDARRRDQLMIHLGRSAPLLAVAVEGGDDPLGGDGLADQWRIRQLTCWLDRIEQLPATGDLQRRLESLAVQRRVAVAELVTAMAWDHLASSVTDKRRRALNRFTEANRKIGRATGRYAPMWQAEARAAMDDAKDAVPVWIMPIHKVISSFRPNADPPFDVIIIDEASQVGLLESLVLGLAKQAIVVGDEKQTSPENVGLERQSVYDALDRHFPDMPDRRTRFSPDNSLYDLARQQFPDVVQLTEHFRSLPQLIEFSSRRWYDGSIVPLRDRPPTPGWQQLGSVFVPRGTRRGNDDANMQEAEAVVALIDELVRDSTYDGMSIGVITLMGTGQAPLISGMLLDRLGPQVVEERAIRVGDAAGFQGDERDVIVYSLVVAHDPDRRIGAMTDDAANRRINVAASRARNQSWMVHSVQPEDLHRNDPRRWLLEYHLAPPDEAELQSNLDVADSDFERDVIREIVAAGYRRVRAQYLVGGYRIDIVVEGPDGRLAVECDGDFWHGPERWQADRERQQVLERAGWTFERIRGSSFYRNRKAALAPLWGRLRELGIPTGDWEERDFATMRREWPVDFEVGELAVPATESPVRKEATDQALIAQPDGDRWEERATETLSVSPDGSQHPLPGLAPTVAEVRSWARGLGMPIGDRGRLPPSVVAAWNSTHPHQLIPAGEGEPPRRATRQSSHTADGLDGPRTQEYDFYIPILEALVQLGGEAPARQVLPMVEQRMMDEFTPADLQPIASSPDYPRWDKTANWARQELAELGYIVRPGRYGIWEISESGRAWLTGQLGQPSPPSSLAADAAPVGDSEHS